jgi:hypothetical protein
MNCGDIASSFTSPKFLPAEDGIFCQFATQSSIGLGANLKTGHSYTKPVLIF